MDSMQEAKNIFTTLVDEVGKNIDIKLNDFCKKLNNKSIKINKISDNYKKLSRKLLLTINWYCFFMWHYIWCYMRAYSATTH